MARIATGVRPAMLLRMSSMIRALEAVRPAHGKSLISRLLLGLTIGIVSIVHPSVSVAVQRIDAVSVEPGLVFTGRTTLVLITARVAFDVNLIPSSVKLIQVDEDGTPLFVLTRLFDDATEGDQVAGDNIFTAVHEFRFPRPQEIHLQVSASYRNGTSSPPHGKAKGHAKGPHSDEEEDCDPGRAPKGNHRRPRTCGPTVFSSIVAIKAVEPAFFIPPSPSSIIQDGSVRYPVNRAYVVFLPDVDRVAVEQLARTFNARIVAFVPSSNLYTFEMPINTKEALQAVIQQLRADKRVQGAGRLIVADLQARDLEVLKTTNPAKTVAYDAIQLFDAWSFLDEVMPALHSVRVGIVDQGIQTNHPEFTSPQVNLVAAGASTSANFHGTAVAGIIGANDQGTMNPSAQMTGLIAGVQGAAYRIDHADLDPFPGVDQLLVKINILGALGASTVGGQSVPIRLINLSQGWPLAGTAGNCGGPNATEFADYSDQIVTAMHTYGSITFVVAAGNYGIDAANVVPANAPGRTIPGTGGKLSNVITVGGSKGTNPDGPATWGTLCSLHATDTGAVIGISAPGVKVYAPTVNNGYQDFDGTSASAPLVTGAMAMCQVVNPTLTPKELISTVTESAEPAASVPGGRRLDTDKLIHQCLAKNVDVFLIVDLSGSFTDDLSTFKSQAAEIVTQLVTSAEANGLNINFGLARFEDYPISPFGVAAAGDRAYTRVQDISPPTDANQNGVIDLLEVISSLQTRDGADGPQSQLTALFQAATGSGQVVSGFPDATISSAPASWRPGSTRIIVLWTDASFHRPNDPGTIPYPGPSFAATISALNDDDIRVIGIAGLPGLGDAEADLTTVASGTNTVAPPTGVDCDGNGAADIPAGQPVVCTISSTGAGITQAIIATVNAVIGGP